MIGEGKWCVVYGESVMGSEEVSRVGGRIKVRRVLSAEEVMRDVPSGVLEGC